MTKAQSKTLKLLDQIRRLDKETTRAEARLLQLKKKRHPILFKLGWFKRPRFRRQ